MTPHDNFASGITSQGLERAGFITAVFSSLYTALGNWFEWLMADATRTGILIAFCGLLIQVASWIHNRCLKNADKARNDERLRMEREEHELKMAILREELAEAKGEE